MPDAAVQPGEGGYGYHWKMSSATGTGTGTAKEHTSSNHHHHHHHSATKESEMAQKLLNKADEILAQVDDSFIVKQRGHAVRPMPTFRPEELSLGKVLGIGGFCIVSEVTNICLDDDNNNDNNNNNNDSHNNDHCCEERNDGVVYLNSGAITGVQSDDSCCAGENEAGERMAGNTELHNNNDNNNVDEQLCELRRTMQRRVLRNGVGRYAIKRLHGGLSEMERARGMVDLAVEAKYLSVVKHPNIIKMRGMASGPLVGNGFFILIDRLHMTLDRRINEWHKQHRQHRGGLLGFGKHRKLLKDLMVERMTVAYDLAAAFFYLHENRLVYRDIKPENIGFDVRNDVKVFDFGLCKSLSPALKARDGGYGYRLTGRAGSLPYMAPEVAKMETYDTKCDVFSFAILLWEILCLKQAFKGLSSVEFVETVVIKKERLDVPHTLPPLTRLMIPEAWNDDPRKRPDMKRIAIVIRGDLNDMTTDEKVIYRTKHMQNLSDLSIFVEKR